MLVPVRCPSPDPPWLLLKIWGHATWRQGYAHACPRIRASAAYLRVGGPGCGKRSRKKKNVGQFEHRCRAFSSVQSKFRELPTYVADETSDEKTRTIRADKTRSTLGKRIFATIRRDRFLLTAVVAFRSSREFLRRRENILIYRSLIKW